MNRSYKTAESVCAGHPDKLCDLIADSILDACLRKDKSSRVACEVLASLVTSHTGSKSKLVLTVRARKG